MQINYSVNGTTRYDNNKITLITGKLEVPNSISLFDYTSIKNNLTEQLVEKLDTLFSIKTIPSINKEDFSIRLYTENKDEVFSLAEFDHYVRNSYLNKIISAFIENIPKPNKQFLSIHGYSINDEKFLLFHESITNIKIKQSIEKFNNKETLYLFLSELVNALFYDYALITAKLTIKLTIKKSTKTISVTPNDSNLYETLNDFSQVIFTLVD